MLLMLEDLRTELSYKEILSSTNNLLNNQFGIQKWLGLPLHWVLDMLIESIYSQNKSSKDGTNNGLWVKVHGSILEYKNLLIMRMLWWRWKALSKDYWIHGNGHLMYKLAS